MPPQKSIWGKVKLGSKLSKMNAYACIHTCLGGFDYHASLGTVPVHGTDLCLYSVCACACVGACVRVWWCVMVGGWGS